MSANDLGNCFMCQGKLSLPTKLNGCTCKVYGCLACVRDYLQLAPSRICPICQAPILNRTFALSKQYERLESLWYDDDKLQNDERQFDSTCRRCDAKLSSQKKAHNHLLTKCPNSQTMCQQCGKLVVRRRLRLQSSGSHYKGECPIVRNCWTCKTLVPVRTWKNHIQGDRAFRDRTKLLELLAKIDRAYNAEETRLDWLFSPQEKNSETCKQRHSLNFKRYCSERQAILKKLRRVQ